MARRLGCVRGDQFGNGRWLVVLVACQEIIPQNEWKTLRKVGGNNKNNIRATISISANDHSYVGHPLSCVSIVTLVIRISEVIDFTLSIGIIGTYVTQQKDFCWITDT